MLPFENRQPIGSCAPVFLTVRRDDFSFESARAAQGI